MRENNNPKFEKIAQKQGKTKYTVYQVCTFFSGMNITLNRELFYRNGIGPKGDNISYYIKPHYLYPSSLHQMLQLQVNDYSGTEAPSFHHPGNSMLRPALSATALNNR